MSSSDQSRQHHMLAQAIYEIRLLLSGYLGSGAEGGECVRAAAHLAYALHNEALAVMNGGSFDPEEALAKLKAVDRMFSLDLAERFSNP